MQLSRLNSEMKQTMFYPRLKQNSRVTLLVYVLNVSMFHLRIFGRSSVSIPSLWHVQCVVRVMCSFGFLVCDIFSMPSP